MVACQHNRRPRPPQEMDRVHNLVRASPGTLAAMPHENLGFRAVWPRTTPVRHAWTRFSSVWLTTPPTWAPRRAYLPINLCILSECSPCLSGCSLPVFMLPLLSCMIRIECRSHSVGFAGHLMQIGSQCRSGTRVPVAELCHHRRGEA